MANIELYEGYPITFENKNGKMMVNATQMGKAFGKQPKDWLRTQASKDFIEALSKVKKCLFTDLQQVTTYLSHSLSPFPTRRQFGQRWRPIQDFVRLWRHVKPLFHPSDNIVFPLLQSCC